ncbi:MAG: ABC transporter permease [Chloroflexi bacterium]|nr:ABC transporter permease [Anaerolineaceae bacterium]NMB88329.1 ABC transporter permease [Chloroflexota bacterium]
MKTISKFIRSTVAGPLAALILVVLVVSLASDRFLQVKNLSNVSLQVATVAVVSIGATLVILTGGIDLSPGSNVALTTCALAILVKNMGIPLPVGIILVLLLGLVLGGVNGFLSTYGKIPSFIVTLATMSIYRGLAFLITNGTPIFSLSPDLEPIFYGQLLGIPLPFYYVITLYALGAIFLRYTILGRAIYALGGNESAARLSGIRVNQTRMLAFVISGLTASIGGVLLAAWLNSGSPNYGSELGLQSIAAAVIGGASLAGGYGSMVATLIGALTVAVVQNGLNLKAVPASWQEITLGSVIVLAVGLDMWRASLGKGAGRLYKALSGSRTS